MPNFREHLQLQLDQLKQNGLYKNERLIITPQDSDITVAPHQEVLNFC